MAVALLLIAVSISFIIVRIGAAALELTGMPWDKAKFQSLSAFTNSGFTTSESEEIIRHPLRRRIVTILIVTGNAGLVATVGSFAGTVLQPQTTSFFVNLGGMVVGIAVLLWLARRPRLTERLRRAARSWLEQRYALSDYAPQDLLHLDRGYRLARVEIDEDSPAVGRSLLQLRLKQNTVQVLMVERGKDSIPVPQGEIVIASGDQLVVFGKAESVDRLFGADSEDLVVAEEAPRWRSWRSRRTARRPRGSARRPSRNPSIADGSSLRCAELLGPR